MQEIIRNARNKRRAHAAEIVVLVNKNESELVDSITNPPELDRATDLLLNYRIVGKKSGRYIPGQNFISAYKIGVRKYAQETENDGETRKTLIKRYSMGTISFVAAIAAGLYLKRLCQEYSAMVLFPVPQRLNCFGFHLIRKSKI